MQLETVPARVARVAVRPLSGGEAWALGTSTARLPGWDREPGGQVVFLKYTPGTGWSMVGPPERADGTIVNPSLSAFAVTSGDEGWAVGDEGVLLRKAPGSDRWVDHPQSGRLTRELLNSVSLSDGSGEMFGYAVGAGPTILRFDGGRWSTEAPIADGTAMEVDGITELLAVSAVSNTEAWAVATAQKPGSDATNLAVYQRDDGGWHRRATQPIFDAPPAKSQRGGVSHAASAGAVAADRTGAWVGGSIFARSIKDPDGDPSPGDRTRPFMVRVEAGGVTSYCPDQYSVRGGGETVDETRLCDNPFPTAPFTISSISIVPGGEVFAGGLGLFRFTGQGWFREPDVSGYLISIAMLTSSEGWVATPGSSFGVGGILRSTASTVGHWTSRPARSALARWSQPQSELLESIALAADGSGRAIGVGQRGGSVVFRGSGWDSINPTSTQNLHGVAWPASGTAWAVGEQGRILRLTGNDWDLAESPTDTSLFAVAFRSRDEGVAVGLGGTILNYREGRWILDPQGGFTDKDLYGVTATGFGYVIVGRDAAVIEGTPGSWRLRDEAARLLRRPGASRPPTLYAAGVLGDGRVVAGGQDGLVMRERDGSLRIFPAPLEGTVLALAGAGEALFASLSPDREKFRGERPAAMRGTLMRYADGRWRDVGLTRRRTVFKDEVDSSAFEDPVYGIAAVSGSRGWAVGGTPADLKSEEGHFRARPTSAVYRVDVNDDPAQPGTDPAVRLPASGVSFAVFGESWCGKGLCSSAMGAGTMADEVALAIRREINDASLLPNGPRFVVFTGNMRRTGIPEELEEFRRFLRGFRIPAYAAPGSLDRFPGVEAGIIASQEEDQAREFAQVIPGGSGALSTGSNDYWKQVFRGAPAPWGSGPAPAGIRTFEPLPPETLVPDLARTHYAFDSIDGGRAVLRVVVVDSSTRSYGTPTDQNPRERQDEWLKAAVKDAAAIPTVVVMNQPTVLPASTQIPNWLRDREDFETTVSSARVAAVIAGGPRVNSVDSIPNRTGVVPMYIVGGGGAPLGGLPDPLESKPPSKLPTDGYYHAWHLVTVSPPAGTSPLDRASAQMTPMPVLESVAVHSHRGTEIPAGHTTKITGLARGLNGGTSDPEQANATYIPYGQDLTRCRFSGQAHGACIGANVLMPGIRLYSEQPEIADFVLPDPLDQSSPIRVGADRAVVRSANGASGLLCTFRVGTAWINIQAGFHRSRLAVTVGPGNGRCIDAAAVLPNPPQRIQPVPEVPEEEPVPVPRVFRPLAPQAVVVFPPVPPPVVAPAPPGAPGVGRKEEHELQPETEGHDDNRSTALELQPVRRRAGQERYAFTAVNRKQAVDPVAQPWMVLGSVLFLSFAGAVCAAAARERRWRPSSEVERV